MRITKTKIASVVAVTAVVALGGTAAMAYWTTTGSGSGSATATTSAVVNVVFDTTPSNLAPGVGSAGNIGFHLNNTATFKQYVSGVSIAIKNVDGSAWSAQADSLKPACTKDDFTITQPAAINAEVPAGVSGAYTATIAMIDGAGDQANCKSVTPPLAATLS